MTRGQIATICKAIEELEARGMKNRELKTLFTDEAYNLFSLPVFECGQCGKKVCYNELVNADEMEVNSIIDGYAICEECNENFGYDDDSIEDDFIDEEETDENEKDSIYSLHLTDIFGNGYGLY